jgi:hypothetical protein
MARKKEEKVLDTVDTGTIVNLIKKDVARRREKSAETVDLSFNLNEEV